MTNISDICFFSTSTFCRSHMMQVVLGEHSIVKVEGFEQRFNVSLVIRHYQYRHWSFDNDIMLIKVMDGSDTELWLFMTDLDCRDQMSLDELSHNDIM